MATILDRSSEEEEGMYLIHLYKGEDLQWPFRVSSQKAIAIPLAYHDVTYDDLSSPVGKSTTAGVFAFCSMCPKMML